MESQVREAAHKEGNLKLQPFEICHCLLCQMVDTPMIKTNTAAFLGTRLFRPVPGKKTWRWGGGVRSQQIKHLLPKNENANSSPRGPVSARWIQQLPVILAFGSRNRIPWGN